MKLRILIIVTGLGTGGAERMLVKLLTSLDRMRSQCMVVSLLDSGTQGKAIRDMGVAVYELHLSRPLGVLASLWRLAYIVREFKPDTIQGWMYHGNLFATLAWLMSGRHAQLFWGIRQTFVGMTLERPLTRLVIRLGAACSRFPNQIIFNSRVSAAQHAAIGYRPQTAMVIPNGFDLQRFTMNTQARTRWRVKLGIAEKAPVVGLVARYHPMKDHAGFLRAAAIVRRDFPDAVFVLAGKGVNAKNATLATAIDELGLASAVRLLGEVADTEALYPAFDVLALSSAWGEAFPNVLGEAMACGVLCVATDIGDAREIVGEFGRVVRPEDADALAQAIVAVLSMSGDDRRTLGERARESIRLRYSIAAVADAYMSCYLDRRSCAAQAAKLS